MPSEVEFELQQHLMRYLGGDESLADFEDWFAPALWEIDLEPEDVREKAGSIHILLSELSLGGLTIEQFKSKLTDFIRTSDENHYGESSLAESYGANLVATS
jgi:hypothetical protein